MARCAGLPCGAIPVAKHLAHLKRILGRVAERGVVEDAPYMRRLRRGSPEPLRPERERPRVVFALIDGRRAMQTEINGIEAPERGPGSRRERARLGVGPYSADIVEPQQIRGCIFGPARVARLEGDGSGEEPAYMAEKSLRARSFEPEARRELHKKDAELWAQPLDTREDPLELDGLDAQPPLVREHLR